MLTLPWIEILTRHLTYVAPEKPDDWPRVAILAIEHSESYEDGVGVGIVRALAARKLTNGHLCLIEAGQAPETYSNVLRRFDPTHILLIDSVGMGKPPGAAVWLAAKELDSAENTPHASRLVEFVRYLNAEFNCDVMVLGIQPLPDTLDARTATAAQEAVQQVSEALYAALN